MDVNLRNKKKGDNREKSFVVPLAINTPLLYSIDDLIELNSLKSRSRFFKIALQQMYLDYKECLDGNPRFTEPENRSDRLKIMSLSLPKEEFQILNEITEKTDLSRCEVLRFAAFHLFYKIAAESYQFPLNSLAPYKDKNYPLIIHIQNKKQQDEECEP